ncbi:MAG TPA: hypothetical protein VM008_16165 [Phycisphaerae bacterium]|nr:hypothetical protein [Phycisphaerae bacterium]
MNIPHPHLLAQQADLSSSLINNIFWATILLIFLITIISAVLRRIAKDKALKLFHKYHVSFFSENRYTTWGDLWVFSQGIELIFDKPYKTSRGLLKSSSLVYDDELPAMICMTRSVHCINEREREHRRRQIQRTFQPNVYYRSRRWFHTTLNTLRDAISKTMGLIIGRMSSRAAAVISTQAVDFDNLTGSVINLAANAYEPILERYIGKAVVVEIVVPQLPGALPPPPGSGGMANTVEFPGYLVDYTQQFLAVFNVDQKPLETIEIHLQPGIPPSPDLPDLKFSLSDQSTLIACVGRDAFALRKLCSTPDATTDLGIAMIPGTTVLLPAIDKPTVITVERTRSIDIVVPRSRARIHFGSAPDSHHHAWRRRRHWSGVAPGIEQHENAPTIAHSRLLTPQPLSPSRLPVAAKNGATPASQNGSPASH